MNIKKIIASALALTLCVGSATAFADESPVMVIDGQKFILAQNAWDIDFNGEEIGSHRWGAPYVELKNSASSSTMFNSLGNSFTAHTGSVANTITSEDTGNPLYGNAPKMTANDTNQVQLNDFLSTASGDLIIYEMDYMLSDVPTSGSPTVHVMSPVVQSGVWINMLRVDVSGSDLYFGAGNSIMPMSEDTWYHILCRVNFIDNTVSYYIEGELLNVSAVANASGTRSQKFVSKLSNAAGGTMWLDNIKHYSLNAVPDIVGVSITGNFIDIETSKTISIADYTEEEILAMVSVKYNEKEFVLVDVETTANEKVIRFKASEPLPTAVPIDVTINYMGIETGGTFELAPAPCDVKNVTIEKDGQTYTATAIAHNEIGAENKVVMIMALYDSEGSVVAMAYGTPQTLTTGEELTVSAASSDAVSAKVFFMEDWSTLKPFKDLYFVKVQAYENE